MNRRSLFKKLATIVAAAPVCGSAALVQLLQQNPPVKSNPTGSVLVGGCGIWLTTEADRREWKRAGGVWITPSGLVYFAMKNKPDVEMRNRIVYWNDKLLKCSQSAMDEVVRNLQIRKNQHGRLFCGAFVADANTRPLRP